MPFVCSSCQKHLGIYLNEKLNFSNLIKEKISKANKGIGILRKLSYLDNLPLIKVGRPGEGVGPSEN